MATFRETNFRLDFFESLRQIGNEVVCVFDSYGKADQVGSDSVCDELLVGQLAVRVACRVEYAGTRIGNVGDDRYQFERVHELDGFFSAAFDAESENAAGNSALELLLGEFVILVRFEACEIDPGNFRMVLEELGDFQRVFAVFRHPEGERFKPDVQEKSVCRGLDASEVAHQLGGCFDDITLFAKSLAVGETVIGRVGFRYSRELVVVSFPVEVSAVDDRTADSHRMSVHVFCRRMGDDVRTEFKRSAENRRSERIVDDERDAMPVSDVSKFLNVRDATCRIGDCFSEESLCVRTERLVDFFFACIRIDECTFDTELFHGDGKEVVGAAVNRRGADKMVARFADVEDGKKVGSLSRAGEHSGNTAFEFRYFLSDGIVRRILKTRVEIAICLEIEEVRHLGARVVLESRALVNGENPRFTFLGRPSGLDAQGFVVEFLHSVPFA